MREFVKSFASFSSALVVFGVSQTAKLINGLPTRAPTQKATESFNETISTIKDQFDSIDNAIFSPIETVQNVLIDLVFDFFQPNTFNPATIGETTLNVTKWALGIGAQLIPGGRVWTGGPPQGWGPVNIEDAELFHAGGGSAKADRKAAEEEEKASAEAVEDHRLSRISGSNSTA
jgi:hypothetical protein